MIDIRSGTRILTAPRVRMKSIYRLIIALCFFSIGVRRALPQVVIATQDSPGLLESNSRQFDQYGDVHTYDEILKEPSFQDPSKTVTVVSSPRIPHYSRDLDGNHREYYLMNATSNADLIVEGTPQSVASGLTAGRNFIFSDYTVTVEKVLYSPNATVLPGQNIVVTRAGGIMTYHGRNIAAHVSGFNLFALGRPYLFYLRLLPNGSFLLFAEAAYNLDGGHVTTQPHRRGEEFPVEKSLFMEDVNAAIIRIREVRKK